MAEDIVADLDSLESSKGPEPKTCRWWSEQSPETREAVIRNVARVTAGRDPQ